MDYKVLQFLELLRNEFRKKGYSYLAGVITRKYNSFLRKAKKEQWSNEETLNESKVLLTETFEIIYDHIMVGLNRADTQLNILRETSKFYKESFKFEMNELLIDFESGKTSFKEIENNYKEFLRIKDDLNKLITFAVEKRYILKSEKLDGAING